MASTAITPTRMVLNQLKGRLKTARRGHKLLKDKRDELMRQLMDVVRRNKELRTKVEEGLTDAFAALSVASAVMSPEMLEQSLMLPKQSVALEMSFQNIMSVDVPRYSFETKGTEACENNVIAFNESVFNSADESVYGESSLGFGKVSTFGNDFDQFFFSHKITSFLGGFVPP